MKKFLLLSVMVVSFQFAFAQVALTTSPYTENFDNIGAGSSSTTSGTIPAGFKLTRAASATLLGSDTILNVGVTPPWRGTGRGFKNFASATAVTDPNLDSAGQSVIANRALGVRQTSTFGDPGAAFIFQVTNTAGKFNFNLSFKLQSLDSTSPRITTWVVDYGIGATPTTFTTVTTSPSVITTGGRGIFSNTSVSVNFGNALNNLSDVVTIRVVALTASTGSGNRASSAIDDWSLSWSTSTNVQNVIRDANYLKVLGNPGSDWAVKFNKQISGAAQLQISNMSGQIIWQKALNNVTAGQIEKVRTSALAKGIYVLSVVSKDGIFTTRIAND